MRLQRPTGSTFQDRKIVVRRDVKFEDKTFRKSQGGDPVVMEDREQEVLKVEQALVVGTQANSSFELYREEAKMGRANLQGCGEAYAGC